MDFDVLIVLVWNWCRSYAYVFIAILQGFFYVGLSFCLQTSDKRANVSPGMHSALSYSRNGFGGFGSVRFTVGVNDLKGLLQPK